VIVSAALSVAAIASPGNLSSGERENRRVVGAVGLIGLLDGYLPAHSDRRELWTLDGDAVRWFGLALFTAVGVLLAGLTGDLGGGVPDTGWQDQQRRFCEHASRLTSVLACSIGGSPSVFRIEPPCSARPPSSRCSAGYRFAS
jgi:hypothetical protein